MLSNESEASQSFGTVVGNGCVYCYANHSEEKVKENLRKYDVHSPILCGMIGDEDKVTERKMVSLKEEQLTLFEG